MGVGQHPDSAACRSRAGDDFQPTATLATLRRRAELLAQLRTFFHGGGYWEVETPILSRDTVVDRHLDPIPVMLDASGESCTAERSDTWWLQTSPEFGMKRLLASGAEAIYQVTRAFRAAEIGARHNPEFTMVEWYRVDQSPADAMQWISDLADHLLGRGPAEKISYGDAFQKHVGIDPHRSTAAQLSEAAQQRNAGVAADFAGDDADGWRDLLLTEFVEPNLGIERPTIIYDYPATQAALAQVRPGPPPVAERFELYVDGIELANGYHELLDGSELSRRNAETNRLRRRDGKPALPETSRLLAAMQHGLPSCCGVALGFDRLVMVAVGAARIDEVLAFPYHRA